ncbi:MAG TPA: glycosyltransferase [Thermoanaerobaculia bacterium]|nr:glycosyltransferase [Thermoanaerobaculia bacterium]
MAMEGEPRVAVVHDWLTGMRGGEKVLEAILELVPSAEIFTLFHFPGTTSKVIEERTIHHSSLQRIASSVTDYRTLLPLFPFAIEEWNLDRFDLIVSSSHCVAKGVRGRAARHISYCHTPMRYIWDRFDDYFPPSRPLLRFMVGSVAPFLRQWDRNSSSRVDQFVANSEFVRDRIRRYYDRDAVVVHPFVDDSFFEQPLVDGRDDYHLVVSALVPYKRVDLVLDAARLSGRRFVIIGGGPLLSAFRAVSLPNVEVSGFVSTEMMRERMRRARSLVIPGVEDFGITALEAMACGTPVVAFGEGGVRDTVEEGVSGVFFDRPSPVSLADALEGAETNRWNRAVIRQRAAGFTRARFLSGLRRILEQQLTASS